MENRGGARDRSTVCVGEAEFVDLGPTAYQKTKDRGADVEKREPVFAGVVEDMSCVLVDGFCLDMTGVAEEEGEILEHVHYHLPGLCDALVHKGS